MPKEIDKQSRLNDFVNPRGNQQGFVRVDFDKERRARLVSLNDTIRSISSAVEAYQAIDDTEGVNRTVGVLDFLIDELSEAIVNNEASTER